MITKTFAENFAADWINCWNSHDMDKILSLYSDDFIIESPKAAEVVPGSNGIVSGKENVRNYWLTAMGKAGGLKLQLLELFIGVNGVSLHHLNTSSNKIAIEVMNFNEEKKVNRAFVYYWQ